MGMMARGSASWINLGLSQILELPNRSIGWNPEGVLDQVGDRVERDIATLRRLKKPVQAIVLLVTSWEIDLDTDLLLRMVQSPSFADVPLAACRMIRRKQRDHDVRKRE